MRRDAERRPPVWKKNSFGPRGPMLAAEPVSIDGIVAQRREWPADDSKFTQVLSEALNATDASLEAIFGPDPQTHDRPQQ